jgi:methylenetetrahydrofolate dehydrogenase (NADP+) / methenyltetrahydrofolate cyclohydrolase
MNCLTLDGRPVARDLKCRALEELRQLEASGIGAPSIHIVSVGRDPSAIAYASAIIRTASSVGLTVESVDLSSTASQHDVNSTIESLNGDNDAHGIIVLQPLPGHLSRVDVSDRLDPLKDVDGITTFNAGRLFHDDRDVLAPSTPAGGMALLKHYGIEIAGRHAVVVGRSPVVGKPMSLMLLAENATVTMCHSRTRHIRSITSQADILISAVGNPGTITRDMVKPGATVIDFGVNFLHGKMTGDVEFEDVRQVASAITPVPGGTGRVTTMVLVRNTIKAMKLQLERSDARRTTGQGIVHAKGTL